MKINLSSDVKVIILPVTLLLALVTFGFVLLKFGLAKFMVQQKQITDTQKEILTLEQKDVVLRQISSGISTSANSFSFALPNSNPTSMVISQIKILSVANSVLIDTISSRPVPPKDALFQANINVSVTGSVPSILSFLNSLGTVSPLVIIKSANLEEDKTADHTADISLISYWSPFPETIPATTDPITELTISEKNMISQITGLTPPSFTELSPQGPSSQRNSPF